MGGQRQPHGCDRGNESIELKPTRCQRIRIPTSFAFRMTAHTLCARASAERGTFVESFIALANSRDAGNDISSRIASKAFAHRERQTRFSTASPDMTNYRRLFWTRLLRLLCFAFGMLTIHEAHARLHDRFA